MSGPAHMERIGNAELWLGDCREVLPTLPSASVHCVVTSPPYWNLRDYGTARWEGGDATCRHTFPRQDARLMVGSNGTLGKNCTSWTHRDATPPRQCECGARRIDSQIGLEADPETYIATLVGVFREVRRVLRPDGTCWINLGDSYVGGGGYCPGAPSNVAGSLSSYAGTNKVAPRSRGTGLAAKQLLMMPARLALALQADGWWLRSDIIWSKPNPMPESVTDRPTSAHEHVFLLTRSPRYFYDADAVREPSQDPNVVNGVYSKSALSAPDYEDRKWTNRSDGLARPPMTMRDRNYNPAGRNIRNVWTVATEAFPQSHYATMPTAIVERCIRAGTSERGCCAACGAPWRRITERCDTGRTQKMADGWDTGDGGHGTVHRLGREAGESGVPIMAAVTTGWRPSCACEAARAPVAATVLDPFAGAGTTLLVADRLQRRAVGIELNGDYTRMAMARVVDDAPLFTAWAPAEDAADARMADLFESRALEAAE